ncbi:MAG: hypothetical protein M3R57_05640, partial [Chloroflexota bacterium]|nr:hypothetical protein [Chloroflexota bacterium]
MLDLLAISTLVLVISAAIALWLPLRGPVERVVAGLVIAHATVTGLLLVAGVLLRALQPSVVALLAGLFGLAVAVLLVRADRSLARRTVEAGRTTARDATRGLADA